MEILKKFKLKDNTKKLNKIDWIIMGIMVLIYGILSFIRLGDIKVPESYQLFKLNDQEIITLKETTSIGKMRYYTGNTMGKFDIYSSINGQDYESIANIEIGSVFTWQEVNLFTDAKYIKIICTNEDSTLGEVAFIGSNNTIIPVVDNNSKLIDEVNLVPSETSFLNSTYFDEIYYGRTVYEFMHGISAYEWTHPPLGKLIMAIPVALFGFSPFNYRLMGNIFGILMIPLMYILGKRIFKNRQWAILAGLLMMFDNFHFAHTRIALVDGFQLVFILLSVLFMKEYMDLSMKDSFKKKAIYLLLSGISIGCAIATKWNALYVGLGLAIAFFVHLFRMYHVNIFKFFKEKFTLKFIIKWITILGVIPYMIFYLFDIFSTSKVSVIALIVYYFFVTCLLFVMLVNFLAKDKYLNYLTVVCVGSFIVVPILIYIIVFLISPPINYYDGTLKGIIDVNRSMYEYHSTLQATHPFSSMWYEWPIMYKPVWLFSGGIGKVITISDFGNPIIWWSGIVAFIYLVISSIKKRDIDNIYLLVFIISTIVPYIFIGRSMFMYHYFITLPFVMLGIVSFIKWITSKLKNDKVYYGYIILIMFTFIIFYPIVSGMPVSRDYVESLKWLSTWYF